MGYEVWDVTNVPAYPNQENFREVTARPAIIIEDLQDEVSVCCLTKQLHQATKYKYAFVVKEDSEEGKQMGLTFDSLIILDRIFQFKKFRLAGVIGTCPQSIVDKIEEIMQLMRKNGDL
jgi:hypothetical protein